eukprot:scaffold17500_cov126-Isochrysis_galbana.AAC.4
MGCAEVLCGVTQRPAVFSGLPPRVCCARDLVCVCGGRRGGASGPCGARWQGGKVAASGVLGPGVGPPLPLSGACLGL